MTLSSTTMRAVSRSGVPMAGIAIPTTAELFSMVFTWLKVMGWSPTLAITSPAEACCGASARATATDVPPRARLECDDSRN